MFASTSIQSTCISVGTMSVLISEQSIRLLRFPSWDQFVLFSADQPLITAKTGHKNSHIKKA